MTESMSLFLIGVAHFPFNDTQLQLGTNVQLLKCSEFIRDTNGLSPSGKAQDFDSCITLVRIQLAQFVCACGEMADALDSKSSDVDHVGSNPTMHIME